MPIQQKRKQGDRGKTVPQLAARFTEPDRKKDNTSRSQASEGIDSEHEALQRAACAGVLKVPSTPDKEETLKASASSQDLDTSLEESIVVHVLSGAHDVLKAEAEARAKLPAPPRCHNYGRLPLDHYRPARGFKENAKNIWPEEPLGEWNAWTAYNAAGIYNRFAYQELSDSCPLIYPAPVAFHNMEEFEARQKLLLKGKDKFTRMLEQENWANEDNLSRKDIKRILESIKAVQKDEYFEMTKDFVLGTLDGLLTWATSQHLTKSGRPFYFVCYARPKALFKNSASERLLLDEKQTLFRGARLDKELKLKELEFRHGCHDVHALGIRAHFALHEKKWQFEIFDSNYKSTFWEQSYRNDGSTLVTRKLSSIPFLGGLVRNALLAIKDGKTSAGDKRSTKHKYTIVRNGGGNRATERNPTGLCVPLSLKWVLQRALCDLGPIHHTKVSYWKDEQTQTIRYIG